MSIIDIAWGQAKGQDLALIVDDQVQLEAVKPTDRGLATSGTASKDAMGVNTALWQTARGVESMKLMPLH